MSSNQHLDDIIPIYALGALSGKEKRDVEAHIRGCSHCRAKLAEARSTVNVLPSSVEPVDPSPQTKHKLFARVEADLARPLPASLRSGSKPAPAISFRPILMPRLLAIGLLAVLLLLAIGLAAPPLLRQLNEQREITAILTNPGAQTRVIHGTRDRPTAHGRLTAVPGDNRAVLEVDGLGPLPPDKTYEFWLIRGSLPVPSGLFDVSSEGTKTMLVSASEGIDSFDKLGVTIERSAGEEAPKGTLVLQLGLE